MEKCHCCEHRET